jgi:NhaC family Na+:H+ antiporter
MKAFYGSIQIVTGQEIVDDLLSSGGMYGMLGTVWLIVSAMIFGGVMEGTGMLRRIAEAIISVVNSTGSLVASTVGTCVFFNITASDQYLAIVVPGRMYTETYKEKGLAPENLSRTLEDSGTVTSALIPWNTCGAYHANVLGVATFAYLPFAFFNLISPFMTIFYAYMGIKIHALKDAKTGDN